MSDNGKENGNEEYQRIRSDFDALSPQEKVVFLAEAASATVVRGFQQFGQALSHEIDDMLSKRSREGEERRNEDGPEADEEDVSPVDAAVAVVRSLQRFGQALSHEVEDMLGKHSRASDSSREESSEVDKEQVVDAGDSEAPGDANHPSS